MLSFENDYIAGAHPSIIESLSKTNFERLSGYGNDMYCARAKEKIKTACGLSDADIFFLVGGTITNQTVITAMLAPFEGVISADSGHINVHEAGAVEFSGHKVLTLPQYEGKIRPVDLEGYLKAFYSDENNEHMVFPGMVYISHPTEYGTLYTKTELEEISSVCKEYKISLFMDGARLGYGLMSYESDLTLKDIADLCDVFYIGGTKVGALCGEAVVFTKNNAPKHFFSTVKQQGALLAKGRLLGIQFDTLFTDDLYFKISRHAIDMAQLLKKAFLDKGYKLYVDSPTNQQFVILDNQKLAELKEKVAYTFWQPLDDSHSIVRFTTSWATMPEDIKALKELI